MCVLPSAPPTANPRLLKIATLLPSPHRPLIAQALIRPRRTFDLHVGYVGALQVRDLEHLLAQAMVRTAAMHETTQRAGVSTTDATHTCHQLLLTKQRGAELR